MEQAVETLAPEKNFVYSSVRKGGEDIPTQILSFSGSATGVTDMVSEHVAKYTKATAEVHRDRSSPIKGRLTLSAATQEDLEAAVRYLTSHPFYRHHFRI